MASLPSPLESTCVRDAGDEPKNQPDEPSTPPPLPWIESAMSSSCKKRFDAGYCAGDEVEPVKFSGFELELATAGQNAPFSAPLEFFVIVPPSLPPEPDSKLTASSRPRTVPPCWK